MSTYFNIRAGRKKSYTPVPENIPGADSPTRTYIPGYADNQIVYLDTVSGNDANDGSTEALAKLTYASAATAAGSTKKIRVINDGAVLSEDITKPTEMKIGSAGTITTPLTTALSGFTEVLTPPTQQINATAYDGGSILMTARNDNRFGFTDSLPLNSTSTVAGQHLYAATFNFFNRCFYFAGVNDVIHKYKTNEYLQVNYTLAGGTIRGIHANDATGEMWAFRESNYLSFRILYSVDGITFTELRSDLDNISDTVTTSQYVNGVFYVGTSGGKIYYSTNATSWPLATTTGTEQINHIYYSDLQEKFVAVRAGGVLSSSADGITWANVPTPDTLASDNVNHVRYYDEWQSWFATLVQADTNSAYLTSFDGETWTKGTPIAQTFLCHEMDNSFNELYMMGGTTFQSKSNTTLLEIRGPINGFTYYLTAASQSPPAFTDAYFCTLFNNYAPYNKYSCKILSKNIFLTGDPNNNNETINEGNLFSGSANINGSSPIKAIMRRNTIAGILSFDLGSTAANHTLQDNIIENGVSFPELIYLGGSWVAAPSVFVESGNTRGNSANVTFGALTTSTNPRFMPDSFILQRQGIGALNDSPLVGASFLFTNSIGDPADIGAYRYNDSTLAYIYERSINLKKPSLNKGGEYSRKIKNRITSLISDDGTPDVLNDKESRTEILTIIYNAIEKDHFDFFEWLEGNSEDMTVELSLTPDYTGATTVETSGIQVAGAYLLTLVSTTGLKVGDRLSYSGDFYWISQIISSSQIVLASPLQAEIPTATEMKIEGTGYTVYQYEPPAETMRKNWLETNNEYFRGLTLKFLRKL